MDTKKRTDFCNSKALTNTINRCQVDLNMFCKEAHNLRILCLEMVPSCRDSHSDKNYSSRKSKQQYC